MTLLKHWVIGIVAVFFLQTANAQTKYINYTIKQGETLSGIAQKYKTTVGDIMRLNGMHADSKLQVGKSIKIPTSKNSTSAVQSKVNTSSERLTTAIPRTTTHVVTKGETLYGISKKYGVTVQQIKSWNHLTSDYAQTGETLVIGADAATVKKSTVQSETASQQLTAAPQKQRVESTTQAVENNVDTGKSISNAVTNTSLQTNTNTSIFNSNAITNTNKVTDEQNFASTYSGDGYFSDQYKKSGNTKTTSGISKTFKTASGWSDGKFYILANDIEPGTIVKLTADNGKSVYAKVLWNMGDLKDNAGINFRISNATAAALSENTDSFNLYVAY
ncbi:MAG: LysM peptidoglycan-binding domain-containing protein [Bacteroidetes bacterium]|nr:LysM peptidoglycan-binding domain-containing protein [Bacteroidota bacterium]